MTRSEIKNRLKTLHDGRPKRDAITDAEWDEIDRLEDRLAAMQPRRTMGYYPACFATANPNEI